MHERIMVLLCGLAVSGCITIEKDDVPNEGGQTPAEPGADAGVDADPGPPPDEAVPVGKVCTDRSVCGSDGNCVFNPTITQATCRPKCDPAAPACGEGEHCITFSDGSGACLPRPHFESQWSVTVVQAALRPSVYPDPDAGAPDPYVWFWADGIARQNQPVMDTYQPVWQYTFPGTWAAVALQFPLIDIRDYDGLGQWQKLAEWDDSIRPYWDGEAHRYVLTSPTGDLTIDLAPHE